MRLKKLNIKGFKSFADNTQINFNEDVIGIVGPNGCGKSNIVDAIRWVLGEQKSKELRSEKMSNVIFNGTKSRKQSGLAEVSLTFENDKGILPTEYNNVTITRQLYRTGESEYRLNGVPCRLKDIKTLFLDTGIGSNSYAIIALNMVDDLLNDRDDSRRMVFEQAAGISKYKTRKHETLNKLKGTQTDLDRVEDLLFEIEDNLKKLERQAKRTKKYFEIKSQYKELSLELAVYELVDYKKGYKEVTTQIEGEQAKLLQLDAAIHSVEAAIQNVKKYSLEKEQNLSKHRQELSKTTNSIRNKENDKKVQQQKVNFIQQNEKNLQKNIATHKVRIAELDQEIKHFQDEVAAEKRIEYRLEDELTKAEDRLQEIRQQHGSVKTELDDFIKNQQALDREIFDLEKRQAISASQVENLERDIYRIEQDIARRHQEFADIETKLQEKIQLQIQKETLIQQLEKEEEKREKNIETTNKSIESTREELVKVNRKLDATRNEYKLTKSLVENLEGFPESIKFLSKSGKWQQNAPLLSDIIFCKEDYRVAIENYLGNYLNYYVVKNTQEAMQAIHLLDGAKKGKANFFLLDAFKNNKPDVLNASDSYTSALNVVEVDKAFQPLIDTILGKVFIYNNEEALEKATIDKDLIFISQTGRVVRRRFSMSGGSVGLFEGKKIGRKKNLERLEKETQSLETQSQTLSETLRNHQQKLHELKSQNLTKRIKVETSHLDGIRREIIGLNARMENFEQFINDANEKKAAARSRIEKINQENHSLDGQLNLKRTEINKLQERISQMDGSYRTIAEQLSTASQQYNQRNIEFIRQQNKINTLQRELQFRDNQLKETHQNLSQDRSALKRSEHELDEALKTIKLLDTELIALYEDKENQQAFVNSAEEAYFKARGSINEQEEKLRHENRKRQHIQTILGELKDKLNEMKLQFNSIMERLKIEFDISPNHIINNEPNPDYTLEGLTEETAKLKKRLANYGEINPMAIEAYNEIKERYDFIVEQRDDLIQSKETLLNTIQEIEATATEHFLDAFIKVRENFIKVFRSLFEEDDTCDLYLDDPSNPLESKIKITAKPKGKKPLTINQLSGGEKTLTTTALLFALYLLKPAPFCVFDEVDAPLDDANISKFNKIIQEFSSDSQFIIVTHNKQTMTAVDIIYGVTMREGVSKVVPVDFRNLN